MTDRPYHHGGLPAALLERAELTLRQRGGEALSLRELARDVGVSPAAPSRHFKTKQALLDALALQGFERLAHATAMSLDAVDDGFPRRLSAVARAYVEFAVENAALVDLMFSAKHQPGATDVLREAVRRWSDHLLNLIELGQQRGEVRPGSPESIALPIFATLQGYAALRVSGVLPAKLAEDGFDDVIGAIRRGCAPDSLRD